MNIYNVLKKERNKNENLTETCCRLFEIFFKNNDVLPNNIYLKNINGVTEEEMKSLIEKLEVKVVEMKSYHKENVGYCFYIKIKHVRKKKS